jgi:peptide/nickel transport system permease protein
MADVAELTVLAEQGGPPSARRSGRRSPLRRLMRQRMGVLALTLLIPLYLAAFVGPLAYRASPTKTDPLHANAAVSRAHPLGTDELGRDELARLLHGGRVTLSVGLVSMVVALAVGLLVGGVAGYYAGWVEIALMRFVDMFMSIPPFFLILVELAVFGNSPVIVIVVVGLSYWGQIARVVYAEFLRFRQADFVEAMSALGARGPRILFRHILPQVVPSAVVLATLVIAWSILTAAALSYLGLGIQPPLASWGNMLQNAQSYIWLDTKLAVFPGVLIGVSVLSFNLLGNALRDVLDPRNAGQ